MTTIYRFKDLSKEAQTTAINDYITFLVEITEFEKLHHNSNLYKACKEAMDMKTPWFIGEYIWNYCKKSILKDLNNDFFNVNGEFITDIELFKKQVSEI